MDLRPPFSAKPMTQRTDVRTADRLASQSIYTHRHRKTDRQTRQTETTDIKEIDRQVWTHTETAWSPAWRHTHARVDTSMQADGQKINNRIEEAMKTNCHETEGLFLLLLLILL